ncbi:MAG: hypothetical protein A3J97_00405 [Spirochaetes bacterium RIFOXYC1_FULL_54_7]|nr:MAG: hypothetical protein A3J97_00405 [Spirochaetes bacterium RIFOXYC1_FULL_54_7]
MKNKTPAIWLCVKLFGLFLLVTILVACTNPFGLLQKERNSKSPAQLIDGNGKGTLRLNFSQSGQGRTIAPGTIDPTDLSYTITLTRSGFPDLVAAGLVYAAGGQVVTDIEPGEWQLIVEGFLVSPPSIEPAYRGSMSVNIVGGNNPVNLTLDRLQLGTGDLTVYISWPMDNPADPLVDSYELLWTDNLTDYLNGVGVVPPFTPNFSDTSAYLSIAAVDVPSGNYYMTIIWKKDVIIIGYTKEAIQIYDTLASNKTIPLPAGSFSSPPPVPTNSVADYLRDMNFDLTEVILTWDDISYTETAYRVYRSINAGAPIVLAGSLLPNSTEYIDTDVIGFALGDSVVYTIAAANNFGEGKTDTTASTLRSMSFAMGTATAGTLPPNSLVFSGEQFNLPKGGNLVGPYLAPPDEVLTQRFTGWHDGVAFFYEEQFLTMPDENVVFTTQWTDDTIVNGKVGPAGGYIFYRNPNPTWSDDEGWLYLEIAPQDEEAVWISGSATQTTTNGYTGPDIGWGKLNTMAIMAQDGHTASSASQSAGLIAGGFSDWFLPSEYELTAIYNNLWVPYFLGNFVSPNIYWASNETDASNSRGVSFNFGSADSYSKSALQHFRPIRAFRTANPAWLVRYHPNQADSGDAPSGLLHYEAGESVSVADAGSLGRTGYIFQYWNTQADGGGVSYAAGSGSFTMPGGNLTLYAKWRLPDIPSAPSGLDAGLSSTGVLLSWTDNGGTETGYRVYRDGNPLPDAIGPDAISFEDTPLTGGTSYEYYITAYTGDGESAPSSTLTITYLDSFVGTGDPANASVDQDLTLDFYYPPVSGATEYSIYLSSDQAEVISLNSNALLQSGSTTDFTVGPLSQSTLYYWRLVASDGNLAQRVSPVSSFTTGAQPLPVNTVTANLDAWGIQLGWTHTASGQTGYNIYRNSVLLTSVGAAAVSHLDNTTTYGSTYTYEVRPFNGIGETPGPTTNATRIDTPILVYPANAAAAIRLKPSLSWNPVAGAAFYDVYLSTVQADVLGLAPMAKVADAIGAVTFTPATNLSEDQHDYYWRVVARSPEGFLTNSQVFSFSTRGDTQYVGPMGSNAAEGSFYDTPLQTIGEALARAVNGDTILVMEGTYLETLVVDKDILLIGSHDSNFMSPSVDTNPTIIRNPTSGADSATLTVGSGGALNLQDVLIENGLPGGNFAVDAMRVLDGASTTLSSVRLRSGKDVSGSYPGATSSGLAASGSAIVTITGDTQFIMGHTLDYPYLARGLYTTDTFSGTITLSGVDNIFKPVQAAPGQSAIEYRSVQLLSDPVLQSTVSISGADFQLGQLSTVLGSKIITITAPQTAVTLEGNTIREAINTTGLNVGIYAQASRSLLLWGNIFPWDDSGVRDDDGTHIAIHVETANHLSPPRILGNKIALGPNISANSSNAIQVDAIQAIIANNVTYRTSAGLATDSDGNTHYAIKLGTATGAPSSTIVGNTLVVDRVVSAYQNFFIQYVPPSAGHGVVANNLMIAETATAKIDYQNYPPSDATVTVFNNAFGPNTAIQMPAIVTDPISTLNGYAWADANYYIDVHGLDTRAQWFSTLAASHVDILTGGSNAYLGDPDLNIDKNNDPRSNPVSIGAYEVN